MAKVRALTSRSRHKTLTDLLRQLNWTLRGWCNYFRHGVSAATFRYLDLFAWRRVTLWLHKRHLGINWKVLYRRFLTGKPGHRPAEGKVVLFQCQKVAVTCYRWRADNIPHHGPASQPQPHKQREPVERRMLGDGARPVRRAGRGTRPGEISAPRPGPTSTPSWPARPSGPTTTCTRFLDIYSRYAPGWLVAPGESAELAEAFIAATIAGVGAAPA